MRYRLPAVKLPLCQEMHHCSGVASERPAAFRLSSFVIRPVRFGRHRRGGAQRLSPGSAGAGCGFSLVSLPLASSRPGLYWPRIQTGAAAPGRLTQVVSRHAIGRMPLCVVGLVALPSASLFPAAHCEIQVNFYQPLLAPFFARFCWHSMLPRIFRGIPLKGGAQVRCFFRQGPLRATSARSYDARKRSTPLPGRGRIPSWTAP